jgi:hypothetical protein
MISQSQELASWDEWQEVRIGSARHGQRARTDEFSSSFQVAGNAA